MSFLVLAINPHGIKLWLYPYQNMQDSLMINSILEWHSPSLNNPNDYTAFLILGFIILCMIITKNKIKLIDFCVLGFFLILGFKSIRFIPLLYIGASFAIFNLVKEQQATYHNKFVLTLLVFVLIFAFLIQSPKLANNITHNKLIPDKIINYIKEQKPKRLFNYYNYGGYLIYNDIKVFVDGRADMYSNNILQDVVDLQDKGYLFLMKKYDFDMYVVPNDISLTLQLIENSDYCITQQEDNVIIFEKISNCGL